MIIIYVSFYFYFWNYTVQLRDTHNTQVDQDPATIDHGPDSIDEALHLLACGDVSAYVLVACSLGRMECTQWSLHEIDLGSAYSLGPPLTTHTLTSLNSRTQILTLWASSLISTNGICREQTLHYTHTNSNSVWERIAAEFALGKLAWIIKEYALLG